MATSGTATFNLTVDEIVTEAFEQIGVSAPTGGDLRSAKRSLSLLLQEFANRHVFAHTSEKTTLSTVDGTSSYTLPADAVDIKNVTITVSGQDLELERYAYADYAIIPNKTTEGRPTVYTVDRQRDAIVLRLWQTPDAVYTINYEKTRRIQDVGAYTLNIDVPARWLPALVAGLALRLAMKRPGISPDKIAIAKGEYEQQFQLAMEEDRDRTSTFIKPARRR